MFVARFPVRLAEVDWARCVYFARYLDYAHRAQEDFWNAQAGLSFATLIAARKVAFPIVHTEGQYFAPLRLGDTARIELAVTRLTKKSATSRFTFYRGETDERVALVVLKQACIDSHTFVGREYPDDVSAVLAQHLVLEQAA
jgi:YbgC/YbaW family acyl-CoA thioester hydrolase